MVKLEIVYYCFTGFTHISQNTFCELIGNLLATFSANSCVSLFAIFWFYYGSTAFGVFLLVFSHQNSTVMTYCIYIYIWFLFSVFFLNVFHLFHIIASTSVIISSTHFCIFPGDLSPAAGPSRVVRLLRRRRLWLLGAAATGEGPSWCPGCLDSWYIWICLVV